jgi:hypothetical protein
VQQIRRATQRVADMEQPADQRGHSLQRPPLVLIPAPGAGPLYSSARSLASCAGLSQHIAPPAPRDASAAVPPARQRRRHWYADFVPTRNR